MRKSAVDGGAGLFKVRSTVKGNRIIGQKDVPTIKHQQASDPRVQETNEDPVGSSDFETPKAKGEETPDSVVERRFTFSRQQRLRKAADFDRVYSEGRRIASSSLIVFFDESPSGITRLGISVGKRIGKAVVRNRVKRLLREAFRLNQHRLKKGYDILLVARKGLENLKFREVEGQVLELFRRGGLEVLAAGGPREDIPAAGES